MSEKKTKSLKTVITHQLLTQMVTTPNNIHTVSKPLIETSRIFRNEIKSNTHQKNIKRIYNKTLNAYIDQQTNLKQLFTDFLTVTTSNKMPLNTSLETLTNSLDDFKKKANNAKKVPIKYWLNRQRVPMDNETFEKAIHSHNITTLKAQSVLLNAHMEDTTGRILTDAINKEIENIFGKELVLVDTQDKQKLIQANLYVKYGHISFWNTSKVTKMKGAFKETLVFNYDNIFVNLFNEPIGDWDTSAVTDMSEMFYNCVKFDQPIVNWNTSAVKDMKRMFFNCVEFDQPIVKWDTSAVKDMRRMFYNCEKFNQPIGDWVTEELTDINYMFEGCTNFKQEVTWSLPKVTWSIPFVGFGMPYSALPEKGLLILSKEHDDEQIYKQVKFLIDSICKGRKEKYNGIIPRKNIIEFVMDATIYGRNKYSTHAGELKEKWHGLKSIKERNTSKNNAVEQLKKYQHYFLNDKRIYYNCFKQKNKRTQAFFLTLRTELSSAIDKEITEILEEQSKRNVTDFKRNNNLWNRFLNPSMIKILKSKILKRHDPECNRVINLFKKHPTELNKRLLKSIQKLCNSNQYQDAKSTYVSRYANTNNVTYRNIRKVYNHKSNNGRKTFLTEENRQKLLAVNKKPNFIESLKKWFRKVGITENSNYNKIKRGITEKSNYNKNKKGQREGLVLTHPESPVRPHEALQ